MPPKMGMLILFLLYLAWISTDRNPHNKMKSRKWMLYWFGLHLVALGKKIGYPYSVPIRGCKFFLLHLVLGLKGPSSDTFQKWPQRGTTFLDALSVKYLQTFFPQKPWLFALLGVKIVSWFFPVEIQASSPANPDPERLLCFALQLPQNQHPFTLHGRFSMKTWHSRNNKPPKFALFHRLSSQPERLCNLPIQRLPVKGISHPR